MQTLYTQRQKNVHVYTFQTGTTMVLNHVYLCFHKICEYNILSHNTVLTHRVNLYCIITLCMIKYAFYHFSERAQTKLYSFFCR